MREPVLETLKWAAPVALPPDRRTPSTIGAAPLGTWVEFDVGAAITGNGTYSFAISGGSTDAVDFASREAANQPTLVITP